MYLIKLPSLVLILALASCNKEDSPEEVTDTATTPTPISQTPSASPNDELIRRAAHRMKSEIDEYTSRVDSAIHDEFVHGCTQLFKELDEQLVPSFSEEDFMLTLKKCFPIITDPEKQNTILSESGESCLRALRDIEDDLAIKLGVIPKNSELLVTKLREEFERNLLEAVAPRLLSLNTIQATQRVKMVVDVSAAGISAVRVWRATPSIEKVTPPGLALIAASIAAELAVSEVLDGLEKKNKAEVTASINTAAHKHSQLLSLGLKTSLYDYAKITLSQYE